MAGKWCTAARSREWQGAVDVEDGVGGQLRCLQEATLPAGHGAAAAWARERGDRDGRESAGESEKAVWRGGCGRQRRRPDPVAT